MMEFTALANHRKAIRAEIASYAERFRRLQADAWASVLDEHSVDPDELSPAAAVVLMTSVSQVLVLEQALGVTTGHAEMRALVDRYLARFDGASPA
jgi:hypothetical protein